MFDFSPRLFVSYSRQDAEFVGRLEQTLRSNGFSVFRDISGISPGDNFVSTILNQIRKSTGLIAVISDGYNQSLWGKAELHSALTLRKFTIPIVLSEHALSRLEEPLRRTVA